MEDWQGKKKHKKKRGFSSKKEALESEEVMRIYYGADVPEEYRSEVLNAYLLQIADMAGRNTDESEH